MHRTIQDVLWLAPAALQLVIVGNMIRKNLVREYPAFCGYLILEFLRTALLFAIGNDDAHYSRYFYTYWRSEVIVCLVGFGVIVEIFRKSFSKRLGLEQWGTAILRLSVLALVVLALIVAAQSTGSDASKLVAGILVLKRAESCVRVGLIAALFIFVLVLGLPWSSYTVGIATGFAVQGAAEVVVLAVRTQYGRAANRAAFWSLLVAGFSQVFVWAVYFLRPKTVWSQKTASAEHSSFIFTVPAEIDRLNETVEALLERRC
jgi:hypothetical protein